MISNWKKVLQGLSYVVEESVDRLVEKVDLTSEKSIQVVPFTGYGTREAIQLTGRVLRDKGIRRARAGDSIPRNLWNMYKRFESDEVAGAKVAVSFEGAYQEVESDTEGYFHINLKPEDFQPQDNIVPVHLALANDPNNTAEVGKVLIPSPEAAFLVISDIDDTIMRTNATDLLEMFRNTLLKNARTRLPFEGVAEFYTALMHGSGDRPVNPIFYVSNSPWNLYDFLVDFMALNQIPEGPILLRDFGLDQSKFLKDDSHKDRQITRILETYPNLNAILIGDSGERDPEIYHRIALKYPDRIMAVYIRDVTSEEKDTVVKGFATNLAQRDIPMMLVPDTETAVSHARSKGWVK
ncbi:MAG: DUF2183 domain-containing protein [Acidobacteriota bacterium]|nr:DUF2183 domain-containing protein [Acidobacteriota bacterium]